MISWRQNSANTLVSRYVDSYWFLEKEASDAGNERPLLNPDPFSHLIIATDLQAYSYESAGVTQQGCGSHWILPHRKVYRLDHNDEFSLIGIKFRVGALYSLDLPFQSRELDKVLAVGISQLQAYGLSAIPALLDLASQEAGRVCELLDESLQAWLENSLEDSSSRLLSLVYPMLSNHKISEIGGRVHRSQRSIERSFLRVSGLTMKQCQAMLKLDEMLDYLHRLDNKNVDWADIALQFGFSDQPHLIRYMSGIIGKTPGQYEKSRDLTIDVYGRFELE